MASKLMLSDSPADIAVNMVPLSERQRTPVKNYVARIKLRDDTGSSKDKPDRIYITEGSGTNQIYDFIVDYNKIDIAELVELQPVVIPPYLFSNEEEMAGMINRILGTNLSRIDIIYDTIPFDATEVVVNIDNRSLLYKGSFKVILAAKPVSIFDGVETTQLFGFNTDNLQTA